MAVFPPTITPVLRFDGTQPAYQDLAQTQLAVPPTGSVYSIPQPSPLAGSWTAPTSIGRPTRYASDCLAIEPIALDYPTDNGQYLVSPGVSLPANASTIAISFRAYELYGGPTNALLSAAGYGFVLNGNGVSLAYNGGAQWSTGLTLGKDFNNASVSGDSGPGNLACIVARYSASTLDVYIDEEGTVSTASFSVGVNSGSITQFNLGFTGPGFGNIICAQACAVASTLSDTDRASLVAYLKAQGCTAMFPLTAPFIAVTGTSITQGQGVARPATYDFRMLAYVRAAYPTVQNLNVGIVGSGVSNTSPPFNTQYATPSRWISRSRVGNIVIASFGTNDITSNPSAAGVDAALAQLYAFCDGFRAQGAVVGVETVLPRSGLLGTTTQSQFNAGRARWNGSLNANICTHFDVLIDTAIIPNMGADGNSNSLVYYQDGVHPTQAGHALLEPAYTAAVLRLLAMVGWTKLSGNSYAVLSQLAYTLGVPLPFSQIGPQAPSDINGWLAQVLSDSNQSAAAVALRQTVQTTIGANILPTAAVMCAYYEGLLAAC